MSVLSAGRSTATSGISVNQASKEPEPPRCSGADAHLHIQATLATIGRRAPWSTDAQQMAVQYDIWASSIRTCMDSEGMSCYSPETRRQQYLDSEKWDVCGGPSVGMLDGNGQSARVSWSSPPFTSPRHHPSFPHMPRRSAGLPWLWDPQKSRSRLHRQGGSEAGNRAWSGPYTSIKT